MSFDAHAGQPTHSADRSQPAKRGPIRSPVAAGSGCSCASLEHMKSTLLPILGVVVILLTPTAFCDTDANRRVSVAEIESVKLEVEQPLWKTELHIRVHDGVARNRGKDTVSCEIYYVADNGRENKLTSVTLKRVSSSSDVYSGTCSNWKEFAHGNIVKVLYRSFGVPLPISTWYEFRYH
jgi:hypothetical protein